MKNENGITLIALIITIIVMLILVGVTINVVIQGGLFDTANTAKEGMTRELAREELIAAMVGAYDNNGNFVKANVELPEETKWCSKDENYSNASGEGDYVVTKNNEKFYVSPTDGTVMDEEPSKSDVEYYVATFQDGSTAIELVYLVDYKNSHLKVYYGQNGSNPVLAGKLDVTFVEPDFTIILDDVETEITGAIGIIIEDNIVGAYIKDGKFYEGDNGHFSSLVGYSNLVPNFDTTWLVEE